MTREDAIYWLKNLAVLSTEKDMPQIEEALNMAIEALADRKTDDRDRNVLTKSLSFENAPETKRCSKDLISRQAAIDILYDFAGCIVDTPNGYYHKAYKEYRHRLETLPSAEPEPSEIARDIATIIENEMDMRVIQKNAEADHFTGAGKLADDWRRLKSTISELASWKGGGTQEDVCRYILRYMEILEEETWEI